MSWLTLGIVAAISAIAAIAWVIYRNFPVGAIYRSKIHLERSFDSFDDPLAVVDAAFVIRRVNRAYATMVSGTYETLIGAQCYRALRGRDTPCEDCRLSETLTNQSRCVVDRSIHPSGAGAISLTFFPFAGAANPTVLEHIRDISRLEELRHTLERKNTQLEKTAFELEQAQAQIVAELEIAREIQEGIFPKSVPQMSGLRIDALYHPVESVGGDMYDFVLFSPTRLGVFIGDASGHGLPAAFVSTMAKMSLYQHTHTEIPPGDLLMRMNLDIADNIKTSHYLTCFWGVFETEARTFTFARAGHPRPIIVKPDGTVYEIDAAGTLIGIMRDLTFQENTCTFSPGDRVFLFTDGVYEPVPDVPVEHLPPRSPEPFTALLASCASMPFEQVIPHIKSELSNHRREDDYTVVLLEIV